MWCVWRLTFACYWFFFPASTSHLCLIAKSNCRPFACAFVGRSNSINSKHCQNTRLSLPYRLNSFLQWEIEITNTRITYLIKIHFIPFSIVEVLLLLVIFSVFNSMLLVTFHSEFISSENLGPKKLEYFSEQAIHELSSLNTLTSLRHQIDTYIFTHRNSYSHLMVCCVCVTQVYWVLEQYFRVIQSCTIQMHERERVFGSTTMLNWAA